MHTKTELHTHLMGMLSYEGLINFLDKLGYMFPVKYGKRLEFDSAYVERIPAKDALYDMDIRRQLSIPKGSQASYEELNQLYFVRNAIMGDIISLLKNKADDPDLGDEIKYTLYGQYIEESLKELIDQGVEYVEISFSNAKIIENAINYVDPVVLDQIKCKFLLSTDRSKVAKDFRQCSRYMANLIEQDVAVGLDVMGSEFPLSDLDMDRTSKFGLEQKLIPVIEQLNKWQDSTLRIHSGETRNSSENTLKILRIIDIIADDLKIIIPPPQIRIGHGIYFYRSEEYLDLLRKFKCAIEINASSNYALDNIDRFSDIPYNYYLDNDIPVVICSDGHGMYDTTKQIEDRIAESNVNSTNEFKILYADRKILKEKK